MTLFVGSTSLETIQEHQSIQNNNDESNDLLTPTELLFYLSMTFDGNDYFKYIKWLTDKINNPHTLKTCLIHYGGCNDLLRNFTYTLLSNKPNMISNEYILYKQPSLIAQPFDYKIIKSMKLESNYIKNTMLVYQLGSIIQRQMYEKPEIVDNKIDYEYNVDNIKEYKNLIDTFNNIYSTSIGHNPFVLIKRNIVKFETKTLNKIANTLYNTEIMNEVYNIISKLNFK